MVDGKIRSMTAFYKINRGYVCSERHFPARGVDEACLLRAACRHFVRVVDWLYELKLSILKTEKGAP